MLKNVETDENIFLVHLPNNDYQNWEWLVELKQRASYQLWENFDNFEMSSVMICIDKFAFYGSGMLHEKSEHS